MLLVDVLVEGVVVLLLGVERAELEETMVSLRCEREGEEKCKGRELADYETHSYIQAYIHIHMYASLEITCIYSYLHDYCHSLPRPWCSHPTI